MDEPNSTPSPGPEQVPAPAPEQTGGLVTPESVPPTPEKKGEKVAPPERAPGPQPVVLPPVATPPIPPPPVQPTVPPAVPTDDSTVPIVADDVDVIEKEWVNKAKQVINNTKDDPHAQEAAVEKLQREYLKKRYGKEIKAAS